jgi:hypothetical protein
LHPRTRPSDPSQIFRRQKSALRSTGETPLGVVPGPIHAAELRARYGDLRSALRQAMADAFEGAARVARTIRRPTRKGILHFLSYQLLINAVAWTAGLASAGLVTSLFERKGIKNLWGLAGSESRMIVSADDYRLIMMLTSFLVGLSMMMFVRHFALRWVEEIRCVRLERVQGPSPSPSPELCPSPVGSSTDFEELEADHDQ